MARVKLFCEVKITTLVILKKESLDTNNDLHWLCLEHLQFNCHRAKAVTSSTRYVLWLFDYNLRLYAWD